MTRVRRPSPSAARWRGPAATLLTLGLAALLLWWGGRRQEGEAAASERPQEAVWRMLEAAERGDVTAYLDCFSGELRQALDATAGELGQRRFREYLESSHEELVGVAVTDLEESDGSARLIVEYLYGTVSERQKLHLENERDRWTIVRSERGRRERPLIPYGTPIEELDELLSRPRSEGSGR